MIALVPGVRIRHEPRRAAAGKKPWALVVDVRLDGKRHATAKFFATEAQALAEYPIVAVEVARQRAHFEAEQQLEAALRVPALPTAPKGVTLFETMALRWLAEHVKEMCTPATYKNYQRLLRNHLLPIMRTWPMTGDVMSGERLKDVLKRQLAKKGVPLRTRLACHTCLSAFFGWAKQELPPSARFDGSVVAGMGRYVRNPGEKQIDLTGGANPMTRAQVEAFLEYQRQHHPELYEWFVWHVDEGSRVGEVAALKWEHLDLEGGKAHIIAAFSPAQRSVEKADGQEVSFGEKQTKTGRKNQYIDLSDRVRTLFPALRARNREAWMARGRRGPEPQHCFLTRDLTPRRPDGSLYTAFREACDALGLKGETGKPFTIHCLRDTFASLAILRGKPIGYVAMMLGHANALTTQNYYIRWIRLVDVNLLSGEQGGVK